MNINLLNMVKEQARQAMVIVGTMASVVYIMRRLGFEGPPLWQYESYPVYVIGLFLGLMINAYYDAKACAEHKD